MSDGELRIDEYELTNCLATGTHSQVWEAVVAGTANTVALKLLLPEAFADSEQRRVLKHEAKVGATLDHPNVIKIHKHVKTRDHAYIVEDLFRAPSLKAFLTVNLRGVQMRLRKIFESCCLGIQHMHEKGWVHRDLKPENVLVNKASEVRLIDFSLATHAVTGLGKVFAGKVKTIQGTRTYIAPETIRKQHPSFQTDMYSFGVTVYEILTGRPPFMGGHPQELLKKHIASIPMEPSIINSNVTPEMDRLVMRLLKKKPQDRHESMQEVYSEFRALKPFKEEVTEEVVEDENEELFSKGDLAHRLNSRMDHQRTEAMRKNPELARQYEVQVPKNRPVLEVEIVGREGSTPQRPAQPAPAPQPQTPPAAANTPQQAGQQPPPPAPAPQSPPSPPVQQQQTQPQPPQAAQPSPQQGGQGGEAPPEAKKAPPLLMRRPSQASQKPASPPPDAQTQQRNQEDDETSQDLEYMDELPDVI